MEEMGIEQARPALGEIVDRARLAEDYTAITRQGKPAAVVISFRGFATLLRRAGLGDVDPATAEWQQIVAAVREGEDVPWGQAEAELTEGGR